MLLPQLLQPSLHTVFSIHMTRHVFMALSDALFDPFAQVQRHKKAVILGNPLVALLQLCKSLMSAD